MDENTQSNIQLTKTLEDVYLRLPQLSTFHDQSRCTLIAKLMDISFFKSINTT